MKAMLALLPSVVVLGGVLGLRWNGQAAAAVAAIVTALLWVSSVFAPFDASHGGRALADAGVLTVLVAAMIVPGLLFVETTRDRNTPEAIGAILTLMGLSPPRAAILIAIGIGVTVESLTGMGVSLFVTIPLLLRIADRGPAIALGLVGMSLMPWGALAISAHVGAKLAGLPIEILSSWITCVSGAVAFALPLLCLVCLGSTRSADIVLALVAGAVLWLAAATASRFIGIELAGVAGGLAVIVLMMLFAPSVQGLGIALTAPGLRPYLWLLAAVVAQKLAIGAIETAGLSPVLSTGRISFSLLTSPGVALIAATLLSAASSITFAALAKVISRAWRPLASVALFMITARLLVECAAVAALAGAVQGLGPGPSVVVVTALGAVSGFMTGSGVTGNALFMPSAAATGSALGHLPLFAALQNAAAGHAGIASLPVAALLVAALGQRFPDDETRALRAGLGLLAWHMAVMIAAGLLLLKV